MKPQAFQTSWKVEESALRSVRLTPNITGRSVNWVGNVWTKRRSELRGGGGSMSVQPWT